MARVNQNAHAKNDALRREIIRYMSAIWPGFTTGIVHEPGKPGRDLKVGLVARAYGRPPLKWFALFSYSARNIGVKEKVDIVNAVCKSPVSVVCTPNGGHTPDIIVHMPLHVLCELLLRTEEGLEASRFTEMPTSEVIKDPPGWVRPTTKLENQL
jgi:hypothetical protein